MDDGVNQAGDAGDSQRLRCRKCGCEHLPVVYVRRRNNGIVRVRECRNCGTRLRTREQAAGVVPKRGGKKGPPR